MALKDIITVLAEADQEEAVLYAELAVDLTCNPEGGVTVEMKPRGVRARVGGDLHHNPTP